MTKKLYCCREGAYPDALSYGQTYTLLEEKSSLEGAFAKVQGDNGRARWFPRYCFSTEPAPSIKSIRFDEREIKDGVVEVDIHLSNGEWRYIFFCTPQALARSGEQLGQRKVTFHYGNQGMVVISEIDGDILREAVQHILSQGELFNSSRGFCPEMVGEGESPELSNQ